MNPDIDFYFSHAKKWQQELAMLRIYLLDCGLTEEWKWRNPCYTYQKKNIVIIGGFKEYCVVSFFKGALLSDAEGVLTQPTDNVQAGRQMRFVDVGKIVAMEHLLKSYVCQAIEVEKAGLKVDFQKNSSLIFPTELQDKWAELPAFKAAFEALTPGRQKAYQLYFSAPKQSKTRSSRVEKYLSQILAGKGLMDCTCGLSQKMPYCDGSHSLKRI